MRQQDRNRYPRSFPHTWKVFIFLQKIHSSSSQISRALSNWLIDCLSNGFLKLPDSKRRFGKECSSIYRRSHIKLGRYLVRIFAVAFTARCPCLSLNLIEFYWPVLISLRLSPLGGSPSPSSWHLSWVLDSDLLESLPVQPSYTLVHPIDLLMLIF